MIRCELRLESESVAEIAQVASAVAAATGRSVEGPVLDLPAILAEKARIALGGRDHETVLDAARRVLRREEETLGTLRRVLGAREGETVEIAAARVARERDATAVRPQSGHDSTPVSGPTARDGVAGMLLRCGYRESAMDLAIGKCTAEETIEAIDSWPCHARDFPRAALEALAARESCPAGHGVNDACAECAPGEQVESAAPDREALGRAVHDARRDVHEAADVAPRRWETRPEYAREWDRRIGERLFAMGARHGRAEVKALVRRWRDRARGMLGVSSKAAERTWWRAEGLRDAANELDAALSGGSPGDGGVQKATAAPEDDCCTPYAHGGRAAGSVPQDAATCQREGASTPAGQEPAPHAPDGGQPVDSAASQGGSLLGTLWRLRGAPTQGAYEVIEHAIGRVRIQAQHGDACASMHEAELRSLWEQVDVPVAREGAGPMRFFVNIPAGTSEEAGSNLVAQLKAVLGDVLTHVPGAPKTPPAERCAAPGQDGGDVPADACNNPDCHPCTGCGARLELGASAAPAAPESHTGGAGASPMPPEIDALRANGITLPPELWPQAVRMLRALAGPDPAAPWRGIEHEAMADLIVDEQWRAEATGDDGECYVTIFSGPAAEERAREYAAWVSERPGIPDDWDRIVVPLGEKVEVAPGDVRAAQDAGGGP